MCCSCSIYIFDILETWPPLVTILQTQFRKYYICRWQESSTTTHARTLILYGIILCCIIDVILHSFWGKTNHVRSYFHALLLSLFSFMVCVSFIPFDFGHVIYFQCRSRWSSKLIILEISLKYFVIPNAIPSIAKPQHNIAFSSDSILHSGILFNLWNQNLFSIHTIGRIFEKM